MLNYHPGELSIPERAARCLAALPPAIAGQGGHDAAFHAACVLVNGYDLEEDTSFALLLAHYNPRCMPRWTEPELRHKVRDASASPSARGRGYLLREGEASPIAVAPVAAPRPRWPEPDPARVAAIGASGLGTVDLWELSPIRMDEDGPNTGSMLGALFAESACPDPLLCIGKTSREFATRPLAEWQAGCLANHALIVPARMNALKGRTKAGKPSAHTLENTGPRRFVVVEFDRGLADEHAALLLHLAEYGPLALVVHSGGKSLHGWFPVRNELPVNVEKFMRYAASIGADPALFRNPSQFVRLPGGLRDNGNRQSVFYWNPEAMNETEAA